MIRFYHPLVDEGAAGAAGQPVRLVEVLQVNKRKAKHKSDTPHRRMALQCTEQSRRYAVSIVAELERLCALFAESNAAVACLPRWPEMIAVLVPGSPRAVSLELLAAVIAVLAENPMRHIPSTA